MRAIAGAILILAAIHAFGISGAGAIPEAGAILVCIGVVLFSVGVCFLCMRDKPKP